MANPEKTVLIVDDEPGMCDVLALNLKQHGFKTQTALNGKQALEILKEKMPDLIILDVLMPQMDGFELLQELKSNQKYSGIPVIMLTAKRERDNIDKGIALGADFYLPKPFSVKNLLDFINLTVS